MMTGVHEEVTYCSPNTSPGEEKKNHSTSPPQFRSEDTPAMIVDTSAVSKQQPFCKIP